MTWDVIHGDCLDVLRTMADDSIDAVVTDPPYGLSFMGKAWDHSVPSVDVWREVLRVLKPGGHLLCFAGTRTQHRMAVAIEDAGFEIRDMIAWVYGSGFPKSLDVSKAIDKGEGENRARQYRFTAWMRSTGITAEQINTATKSCMASHYLTDKSQPAIPTANMFDRLRPYLPDVPEEIERLVAERTGIEWTAYKQRKVVGKAQWNNSVNHFVPGEDHTQRVQLDITAPATDAAKQWNGWGTALKPALEPITVARKPLNVTVADNVMQHGTGALNIDGCRIGTEEVVSLPSRNTSNHHYAQDEWTKSQPIGEKKINTGRWPANLIHDGSDEVTALFPETAIDGKAARFFYCAKASKEDRDEGCERLPKRAAGMTSENSGQHITRRDDGYEVARQANHHPTVKPTNLMRYLCRLVTPPDGVILDPFTGSGSTGKAAGIEGFSFIGIELDADYVEIAKARIAKVHEQGRLF